jgi:hypothetical protein
MLISAIGSLAVAIGGFRFIVASEQFATGGELTAAGFCLAAVIGIAFVALQMLATSYTLALALGSETGRMAGASDDGQGDSQE